ncbi:MAG: enoyl-CoA hydratase/isomerase family protein [Steroidobacteraceae bacterium]|jgi:enoyl-CoA hydratase/carnithine racemase|nr:enoyl-CoA hydratase/isomerase family protein [Steroidobacteraceae bacterium]
MNESIRYEKAHGVATLTKTNAQYRQGMTREVLVGLKRGLEDARDDAAIRVVVITASGDGFHEGARVVDQLRPDMTYTPMEFREIVRFGQELTRQIERLEKPVIGVAKGGARGGGFEMLHACDFVIAALEARFSQPEVLFGLIAGWGGTQRAPRMVAWRRAKELLLCGDEISGEEAAELGLITRAAPLDRVDAEVQALIARLMKASPLAQGATKLAMNKAWEAHLEAGLDYEMEAQAALTAYREFPAYMQALGEGRAAEFVRHQRLTGGPDWK